MLYGSHYFGVKIDKNKAVYFEGNAKFPCEVLYKDRDKAIIKPLGGGFEATYSVFLANDSFNSFNAMVFIGEPKYEVEMNGVRFKAEEFYVFAHAASLHKIKHIMKFSVNDTPVEIATSVKDFSKDHVFVLRPILPTSLMIPENGGRFINLGGQIVTNHKVLECSQHEAIVKGDEAIYYVSLHSKVRTPDGVSEGFLQSVIAGMATPELWFFPSNNGGIYEIKTLKKVGEIKVYLSGSDGKKHVSSIHFFDNYYDRRYKPESFQGVPVKFLDSDQTFVPYFHLITLWLHDNDPQAVIQPKKFKRIYINGDFVYVKLSDNRLLLWHLERWFEPVGKPDIRRKRVILLNPSSGYFVIYDSGIADFPQYIQLPVSLLQQIGYWKPLKNFNSAD